MMAAPKKAAKVPVTTLSLCFSAAQRVDSVWAVGVGLVEEAASARTSVVEEAGGVVDEVADETAEELVVLGWDEELVEVGASVDDTPAVDVSNWNAPINVVWTWGAAGLLQQFE